MAPLTSGQSLANLQLIPLVGFSPLLLVLLVKTMEGSAAVRLANVTGEINELTAPLVLLGQRKRRFAASSRAPWKLINTSHRLVVMRLLIAPKIRAGDK